MQVSNLVEFAGTERFQIRRRLGSGGMGVVYEAFDQERGTVVALKTLRSVSPMTIARLKSEFRSLQGLAHPNLVRMGELLEAGGHWFFTMELIDGCDLMRYVRIQRDGDATTSGEASTEVQAGPGGAPAIDEARLRATAQQLAQALVAIHTAGITHRDVKPSNVLVTGDGRVVLLDFGLARDLRTDRQQSTDADAVGTVAYMAPEQSVAGEIGPASDWYAFGVLLYEALTGTLPHAGKTALEMLMNRHRYPPPPPRAHQPDVAPDLDRLCQDLLALEPSRRPTGAAVLERLGAGRGEVKARTRSSATGVLATGCIGRARELAAIARAFDETRGGARGVWIHGPSGVGKSTLVGRACQELAAQVPDLIVLTGRCYERESVPYKALDDVIDALSHVLRRMPAEKAAGLMPLHASLLPSLFPALGRVPAIAAAPRPRVMLDSQDLRSRAFAALRELFTRLALTHPVLVTIDDVQWSDADSRLLLTEVMRMPEAPPLLLVLSSRTEGSVDGEPPAPDLLLAVDGVPIAQVAVAPLDSDAATELARGLLEAGGDDDADAVDPRALAAEAGGHPLMLVELARHVLTRGDERPLRLDDAILARARAVPADALRVLELVCLQGTPLAQGTIRHAAQIEPGVCDRLVALLRAEHLVRTGGARDRDPIEPFHDRVREAVALSLDAETRCHRHRALASALEVTKESGDQAIPLVRHWEEAGEPDRAAGHAVDGATRARQAMAFDRTAALLGDALRLGTFPPDEARALRTARAVALADAGQSAAAADEFLAAAGGAGPAEKLDLERLAAENYLISGRIDAGLALIDRMLTQLGTSLPKTGGQALRSLIRSRIRLAFRGLRFVERHEEEIPRQVLSRVDLYRAIGKGLAMVDNILGVDFQARALLTALEAGEPRRIMTALAMELTLRASQGNTKRAHRLLEELTSIARGTTDPLIQAWTTASVGNLAYFLGQFAAAIEPLERAETQLREQTVGTIWERSTVQLIRGWSVRQAGQLRMLRAIHDEAVRDADRRGDQYVGSTIRRTSNRIWLAADDPERARRELEAARWFPAERRFHLQHWFELEANVELHLYSGAPALALAALEDALPAFRSSLLDRIQIVRVLHGDLHARALLSTMATSAEPALLLRRVDRLAKRILGERIEYATVCGRILRAALARRRGKIDAAIADLTTARAMCETTGQALHATSCSWRLGELIGGDDGAALRAEAASWLHDEGVVNPPRLMDLIAPGFAAPA